MGCLFRLITLPFQLLYWAVKIPWEIVELLDHLFGHRHHRCRRKWVVSRSRTSRTRMPKQTTDKQVKAEDEEIPDEYMERLTKRLKFARDKRRRADTRLEAYQDVLKVIDEIRYITPATAQADVNMIERTVLDEYKSLLTLTQPEPSSSKIAVAESLNLQSAVDARKHGIQGAQWYAGDDACPLCKFLDGKQLSVDHPDYEKFVPPLHEGCTCSRVYIGAKETNVEFDWETPPEELIQQYQHTQE